MMPSEPLPDATPPVLNSAASLPEPEPEYRWYHKAGSVLFITVCLEIGLFLLIFPWTDYWENFAAFARKMRPYLDNMYVRGAISGVGVVNLYVSLAEVFRLRRFARH
jgi:hypothetical protein